MHPAESPVTAASFAEAAQTLALHQPKRSTGEVRRTNVIGRFAGDEVSDRC